jgi:hypothetical protein
LILQKDGNSRKFKRKEEGLYTETKRRRQKSKDRKKGKWSELRKSQRRKPKRTPKTP